MSLGASTNRTIVTTADSSQGGSSASSGGDNASEKALKGNNASTSDGSISVAGAVAVSTDTGDTKAYIDNGTVNSGAGATSVTAATVDNATVTANGSSTAKGATGVGVGVGINVAVRNADAYLTGTDGVTAGSLTVHIIAPDQTSFTTTATSGAGGASNVGVAGSLAVNVVVLHHNAYIDDGAVVTLSGNPNVTVEADANVVNTAKAEPADGGGDATKVGIGASVAFSYGEDTTAGYIGNSATLSGANGLTLTSNSVHAMDTDASSGGKGGTAITPVVAISVADDDAHTTVGAGSNLSIGGNFQASSSLTNNVANSAKGDTKSSSTGVGISIAVTVVNDSSLSTTYSDLLAGGAGPP